MFFDVNISSISESDINSVVSYDSPFPHNKIKNLENNKNENNKKKKETLPGINAAKEEGNKNIDFIPKNKETKEEPKKEAKEKGEVKEAPKKETNEEAKREPKEEVKEENLMDIDNNGEEEEIEYLDFIPYKDCDNDKDKNIILINNINSESFKAINLYIF